MFDNLPYELLFKIISFIHLHEINNIKLINKKFYKIIKYITNNHKYINLNSTSLEKFITYTHNYRYICFNNYIFKIVNVIFYNKSNISLYFYNGHFINIKILKNKKKNITYKKHSKITDLKLINKSIFILQKKINKSYKKNLLLNLTRCEMMR